MNREYIMHVTIQISTFRKVYCFLCIILCYTLLFPGLIWGDNTTTSQKSLVIGVQDFHEYMPYSQYENEQYRGFNREILDLFAYYYKYTFTYEAYPIKRLYKKFINGDVDLKYPDNIYWSSSLKKGLPISYSKPLVSYIDGVMVRPEQKGKGLESLKTLGIISGFTPFAYLKYINNKKMSTLEIPRYQGLLYQTAYGRVDGAYSNIAVSKYYLKNVLTYKLHLVFDETLPHTKSTRHLSSFKHPHVIKEFNEFLIKYKKEIDIIKKRYNLLDDINPKK